MLSVKARNKTVDLMFAILLSFSFVYALESSLLLNFSPVYMLSIITVVFIIISVVSLSRHTAVFSLGVLGAGVAVTLILLTAAKLWNKVIYFSDSYFYWLSNYIEYSDEPNHLFTFITVLFLCIVVSCIVYIFAVRHFMFPVLLVTGAALFSIQWAYNYTNTLIPFFFFILLISLYYVRYVYTKKAADGKNNYVDYSSLMLWLLPVCSIVVIVVSIFSASNRPVEWKWLDTKVLQLSDYLDRQFDYKTFDYFSIASSGFSQNDGALGGRVRLNNTPVLKVKTSKRVYLRGAVKDTYTGTRWEEANNKGDKTGFSQTEMMADALSRSLLMDSLSNGEDNSAGIVDTNKSSSFCTNNKITITFERLKTKTIFVPLDYTVIYEGKTVKKTNGTTPVNYFKVYNDKDEKKMKGIIASENGSLSVKKRNEKGFTYNVSAASFDYSDKLLISLLRKCGKGFFESQLDSNNESYKSEAITVDNSDGDISIYKSLSTDSLIKTASVIRTKYLQIPKQLPQRVRDLAISLTSKYNNDYDKSKAIEKFLSSKFTYTLDTKILPRNRDFVDYFLFDQKRGYCTYFASAMTVLARCAGIPARYVEGYMLPPSPDKNGYYVVTDMNAHAWVEIYLEGFGWVPFEPTAPFVSSFYYGNKEVSPASDSYAGINEDEMYKKMLERYKNNDSSDIGNESYKASDKLNSELIIHIITAGVILLLALALLIINLVNIVRHRLRIVKLAGLSPRESILSTYEYYLAVLKIQKLGIAPGETPFTYSKRVDRNLSFFDTEFSDVSKIFTKARYSQLDITEKEKDIVFSFHLNLLGATKTNMGRFKFYLFKNILGQF